MAQIREIEKKERNTYDSRDDDTELDINEINQESSKELINREQSPKESKESSSKSPEKYMMTSAGVIPRFKKEETFNPGQIFNGSKSAERNTDAMF